MKNRELLNDLFICLPVALLAFFAMQHAVPFIETSDARYCEIAYEIKQYGHWLIPHNNRVPHITKPPLAYWFTALGYGIWGVSEFGARFFSGLFAMLSALFTGIITWRLTGSRKVARTAALIFMTLPLVMAAGRIVTTDIYLLPFILMAMLGLLDLRHGNHPDRARWLFWIGLGLGSMAKGPIGLLILAGILLILMLWERSLNQLKQLIRPLPVLVFLFLGLWWPVTVLFTVDGAFNYLVMEQMLSRLSTNGLGHPVSHAYYLIRFPLACLPWIVIITGGLVQALHNRSEADNRFLVAALLFPILFFSIPSSKLSLYILPMTAPAAILGARFLFSNSFPMVGRLAALLEAAILTAAITIIPMKDPETAASVILLAAIAAGGAAVLFLLVHRPAVYAIANAVRVGIIIILALALTQHDTEQYLKTAKALGRAVTHHLTEETRLVMDGYAPRGLVLYTGIHPLEIKVDRETLPSEVEHAPTIIRPRVLGSMWQGDQNILLIQSTRSLRPAPFNGTLLWEGKRFRLWTNHHNRMAYQPKH